MGYGTGFGQGAGGPGARGLAPAQIRLVLEGVERIAQAPDESAKLFYDRFFQVAPETRRLFPSDMREQYRKFIKILIMMVLGLHKPELIAERVRELGRSHFKFGVEEPQFAKLGDALFWMIGERLGPRFTPEARAAWSEAYDFISAMMKEALREARDAAKP